MQRSVRLDKNTQNIVCDMDKSVYLHFKFEE
jgi:hypothetical protein